MKSWTCRLVLAAAAISIAGARIRADEGREARISPVVRVFQEASPAVVNLSTTAIVTTRSPVGLRGPEEIFDFPALRERQMETHSVGSGFLIHEDGYLVTNAHVVDRAREVKVTLSDATDLPAEIVAVDRQNDLAVLKVSASEPLHHLQLGRSNDLMPGETVVAIGNPLGLQHTVTTGIISALDRELVFGNQVRYKGLIQTDASINPGNSGGPLLNVLGELIGVNTAIRGDAQNIGFAIPVDRLRDLLPRMLDVHRLRRVNLGLYFEDVRSGAGGVRVSAVESGSPASAAGIRPGDVVTAIDSKSTPDFISAFGILSRAKIDQPMKLAVRAGEGPERIVTLALSPKQLADSAKLMESRFGIQLRELRAEELRRLGMRRPLGLLIGGVRAKSPADAGGIRKGDVLTGLGGWPVNSLDTLSQLLEQINPGDRVPAQILRIRTPQDWERGELLLCAE